MTTTTQWGVLSTAAIAIDHVAPAIQAAAGCEVAAIASRDAGRAAAVAGKLGIPRWYGSYADLLSDPRIDCVYIALPNSMHEEWAVRAAAAGKAVLCEKPMGQSLAETTRIVAAAEKHGVLLAEGFMYRYHDQFQWLLGLIRDGTLGEIQAVRGAMGFVIGEPPNIRLVPELGGGALLDVGCYPLDAMCLVYGEAPLSAQAAGFREGGIDRACAAVLAFSGDRLGVMDATFRLPWLQAPLEVHGDAGLVRIANAYNPGLAPGTAVLSRVGAEPEYREFPGMNMYGAMAESFSRSYRTGEPLPFGPAASLATAAAISLVGTAMGGPGHA